MNLPTAQPGQIIFLNGVSSSGKSSIAGALLELLDRPYFHFAVDAFGAMRSQRRTAELEPDGLAEVFTRTRAGFHRAVAGMAEAGNDIVMDHVLSEPWRLLDCLRVLAPYDVVFVGVHCSIEELTRRELARGDRQPGQGAAQLPQVHAHGRYDIECDTSTASPAECARRITDFLAARPTTPPAFTQLRQILLGPG